MKKETLLFATSNRHKAIEVENALRKINFDMKVLTNADYTQAPLVIENGLTFESNAKKKAHQMALFSHEVTLADDSGLIVPKLNGAPGVHSARYAGEAHNDAKNNAKLLADLGGVPRSQRKAIFHTTLVLSWPGYFDCDLVVSGEVKGEILTVPRGKQCFGYDPLFYYPPKDKTFAQMTTAEKNEVSHRGRAIQNLLVKLPHWWAEMAKRIALEN